MVPRPGMMTILLILILGRLGRTAVRTAKPDSPYSATRPAPAEHVAELSHDLLARSAHARFDEPFLAGHGLLAKSNMALRGREKESADERPRATRSGSSHDSTACTRPAGDGGLCGGRSDGTPGEPAPAAKTFSNLKRPSNPRARQHMIRVLLMSVSVSGLLELTHTHE